MARRTKYVFLSPCALFMLAACADLPSAPDNRGGAAAVSAAPVGAAALFEQSQRRRAEEAGFFTLAERIPGFGGYAFDADGNLEAYIKDKTKEKEDRARQYLDPLLEKRKGNLRRKGSLKFRHGDYTFAELADWRDQLSDGLLGQGLGVRSTDADEAQNRVVVGVADAGARGAVQAKLKQLGIPDKAVLILDEEVVSTEGEEVDFLGLASANNEYYGGLQIRRPLNDGTGRFSSCTMGFYAILNGVTVGVSNSHCSRDRNSSGGDGSQFFNSANVFLGAETHDRNFHDWCPKWYSPLRWCRNADAMLFDAVPGPLAPAMNKIARYTMINPGSSTDPMFRTIDANNPIIIYARYSSRSGELVNKAGISTGQTQGTIKATCKDVDYSVLVFLPGLVMQCQRETDYGRASGDSGAPVFVMTNGYADLRGIHWGRYFQITGMKTLFSPLGQIERDFGSLGGIPTPTPPGGGSSDPGGGSCDPVTAIIPC